MALSCGNHRPLNLRLPSLQIPDRDPTFPVPSTTSTWSSTTGINASDLEKLHVLGSGNGGTVYKVHHKTTSELYALKMVNAETADPIVKRQLLREMEILRSTESPYIVRCHGIFEKPSGEVAILMEYMDRGTLESLRGSVSETQLSGIARQILRGLSYLQSQKIVHRDIKPANILMNSKMEVKIADFGVSKRMIRSLDSFNSCVGTCAYMSPERFDQDSSNENDGVDRVYAGDIWSFGLTLLELYVGHFPLLPQGQIPDWGTLMCAICFGEPPRVPDGASEEFRSFIDCCLLKDPSKRWTPSQLLNHPFLRED